MGLTISVTTTASSMKSSMLSSMKRFDGLRSLVGDAVRRTLSRWPRLLRLAEGAIRRALNAFNTGRGAGVVANAIYQGEQTLRQATAEIRGVTGGARRSSALNAISNAITRLQFARNQLQGISIVPGGRSLTSPADSLRGALEWNGHARSAIGLRVA
jgi:hypothetical protein